MMKHVARLKLINHGAVRIVIRRYVFNGMVNVRIEFLSDRFDPMHSLLCQQIPELFPNKLETLAIILIGGVIMGGECSIETVQHGKKLLNQIFDSAMPRLIALFLSSLPVIVEIRLQ